MSRVNANAQGNLFMTVFSETFKSRPLADWPHELPILDMCPALAGNVEIVGWTASALLQGTTHEVMSMEEFMNAHIKNHLTFNNKPVAPFFFPKHIPSGPDMLFFILIDGHRMVHVFVQTKLRQSTATLYRRGWNQALATVSATCIQGHAKDFRNLCPNNVYISMVVAYPIMFAPSLPPVEVPKVDPSGLQQVVIRVGDTNFGQIFPKDHVDFIYRLKSSIKRTAQDDDNGDKGRHKKPRT